MARHDMLRANINGLKRPPDLFALFGDKCLTRLRIYSHLHPIFKAAMFGIKAIEEFLVFFQLEALAITAYACLHLFRHLSPLVENRSLSPFCPESNKCKYYIIKFRTRPVLVLVHMISDT